MSIREVISEIWKEIRLSKSDLQTLLSLPRALWDDIRRGSYKTSIEGSSSIYEEVGKRKQRAETLKLRALFEELYFHNIIYYPRWIKHSRSYVPSIVTSVIELEKEAIQIELNGKKYLFCFKENKFSTPDGEAHRHGLLELSLSNERLLALNAAFDYEREYDPDWSIFGIEAFIEGDWIRDFQELKHRIEVEYEERKRREQNDPQKLASLKRNFGIR